MTTMIPNCWGQLAPATTGRMMSSCQGSVGAARLSADLLFYADLTLNNIVAGSRYRITRSSNGDELATGVVAGSGLVDEVVAGVPCFSNPMQVDITVRNASGIPAYKIFDTSAFMLKSGTSTYILQQPDE